MTAPDYPMLVLPSSEMYQLAHIATYLADALARHRHAAPGRQGRNSRAEAVRDLAGGKAALDSAVGATRPTADADLPQPIDAPTFHAARELLSAGPRWADVTSLAAAGASGWAVVGHVPGVGPVGARVGTQPLAEALRHHFLTQPAAALGAWAVSERATPVPAIPDKVDLAAFVEHLDPSSPDARAVARHLRGFDRRTDAAIRGRFAGIDLDQPLVVEPTVPPAAVNPAPVPAVQPVLTAVPAPVAAPAPAPARGLVSPPESAPGPAPVPAAEGEASGPVPVASAVPAAIVQAAHAFASPAAVSGAAQRDRSQPVQAETDLRYVCDIGRQPARTTAPSVPASSAGP